MFRLRTRFRRGARGRAALHIQRACRGLLGRKRAASVKTAANLDIWRAARLGNSSRVDALYYGQGLGGVIFDCLNTKDKQGNSLLAKVAGGVGPLSLVRVVLKWGADINAVNDRGETALRLAMAKHNIEIVDFLLNNADMRLEQDKPGKSLLHEAAALGLHHLTAQLMSKGLDVNGVDPENGWTPVHYACHNGREELARLLTSRPDTTPDLDGADGMTALHLAAAGGWEKCAVNLLENRASPVLRNNKGQVPGVTAMLHGHASISKTLLQAFFAAKTTPNRSRATAATAAAPAPETPTSGVPHGAAEYDTNAATVDAPGGGTPSPESGGGGGGGDAAATSAVGVAASKGRRPSERGLLEGTSTVAAAGNDGLLPGGAAGGVEEGGGKGGQSKVGGGGGGGGGQSAVAVSLKSDGGGFVEEGGGGGGGGGGSATILTDGGEARDDGQSSGGGAGDGAMSEATNSSLGVTEAVLGRRASEAGVAVGLDVTSLASLAPRRWDSDDLRCAVALAEKGEVWCLASLFALGLDPLCRHPDSGDTLGIAVTRGGHRATLEVCLEMKVCFAAKNKRGRTALHVAVARDDLEFAALLLANPGLSGLEVEDLCDPDEDGRTPLHEMAARGHAPTVLLLAAEPESGLVSSSRGGGGASLDYSSSAGNDARGFNSGADGDSAEGVSSGGSVDSGSIKGGGVARRHGGPDGANSDTALMSSSTSMSVSSSSSSFPAPTASAGRVMTSASTPSRTPKKGGGGVGRYATGAVDADASNRETPAMDCAVPSFSLIRLPRPLATIAAPSLADTDRFDEHSAHAETPGGRATGASATTSTNTGRPRKMLNRRPSEARKAAPGGEGLAGGGSAQGGGNNNTSSAWNNPRDNDNGRPIGGSTTSGNDSRGGGSRRAGGSWASEWGGLLDVDMRCDSRGGCPLHEAAASGSVGAVLSLLDLGADISMVNGCGDTALHVSVGSDAPHDPGDGKHHLDTALANEAIDASITRDAGRRSPTTQVVRALLRRGADPSVKDASGKTPAMRAVLGGRAGALLELRETALHHATLKAKAKETEKQESPKLGLLARKMRDAALRQEALREKETEKQELSELALVAISEGHVACLRVLKDSWDEDVLAWVDEEGVSALGAAVTYGQRECIDILLTGAGPAKPCGNKSDGNTVLHVAAMSRGGMPVLKRFLPHKGEGGHFGLACLELRNGRGDTVLMAALRAGRHDAALLLLQASAVPTLAAHTFRYAWVIAAALRAAVLCPCPSCVLGRTAEERGRLCTKTVPRQARPGEGMGASAAALNWMAAARAARYLVSNFRAKRPSQTGTSAIGTHSPEKKGRAR